MAARRGNPKEQAANTTATAPLPSTQIKHQVNKNSTRGDEKLASYRLIHGTMPILNYGMLNVEFACHLNVQSCLCLGSTFAILGHKPHS